MRIDGLALRCFVAAACAAIVGTSGCADDKDGAEQQSGTDDGTSGTGTADTEQTQTSGSGSQSGTSAGTETPETTTGPEPTTTASDDTGPPPVIDFQALCMEAPPADAETPPALPDYTGGECPALVPGVNTITSMGNDREFILVAPSDVQPDEILPVVFLWHWLGGDANAFLEQGDVQNAADEFRFVAVIPEEKGDLLFRWPFSTVDSDARMQEEFVFFDDLLTCVAQTYPIEPNCVSSVGVSAGALWTAQLAGGRGEYLSSIVSLSGGTGGLVKPWTTSPHKMPALVLWGGREDTCLSLNFEESSADLEANLQAEGHAIMECVHNCGHAAPPFDQPPENTPFSPMWKFVLDHPYWLDQGESPWDAGFPEYTPVWCAMGVGNAMMREGECGPSQC